MADGQTSCTISPSAKPQRENNQRGSTIKQQGFMRKHYYATTGMKHLSAITTMVLFVYYNYTRVAQFFNLRVKARSSQLGMEFILGMCK